MVIKSVSLGEMISEVQSAHPDGDALDLLEEAVAVAGGLAEVADHLVGHFVDNARGQGLSWTQIGARLGVSKQAARKRFAPDDIPPEPSVVKQKAFGRYTRAAQHAIVLAQNNARRHHHHYIGTEHILLGICQERSGLGVQAIAAAGLTVAAVERAVIVRLRDPSSEVPERIPFTDSAKKALELTLRAALRLGHEQVGTEHLLLGLQAQQTGLAALVLAELGLTPEAVEAEVIRLVTENTPTS
ncbi:ATP-dependent Clp protease ATP-binding subunit [Amycolatopsis cynarae]|uniref:ATP-dependent Clp protease ATP-binding subunit n=1 Tax=Amycolatopsis cynarae TaxID=2995223 RepID=A0ABY7AXG0_9PSEU|nr:Clp protease N-terminal domain-containing protein [Amycolatopsis sp. HUAS 11-8]WAL64712.1 ATP-dependent Clp protease ATP-binding subunit [Amycolatopsis sp. HUAS 11-8]